MNKQINRPSINSLLVVFLLLFTLPTFGQFYSMGNDPARVKWSYSKGEHFTIIYPNGYDSLAQNYFFLLNRLREGVNYSMSPKSPHMNVVIHPFSTISNGMVGWAPSRIELISTPSANMHYVHDWEKHLIAHELRHVAQFSKFLGGVFKPLSWLIGEQANAIGMGLYMSQWTLEGDAVVTETELSSGGRGRDPDHLIFYKASFLANKMRSHDRWTLGSFREYTPDPYSYGYLFNSYLRYKTKNQSYLSQVTEYTTRYFFDPFAQDRGYRKITGGTKRDNFKELSIFYKEKWEKEQEARGAIVAMNPLFNRKKGRYVNYTSPTYVGSSLFALRRGLEDITTLIEIDSSCKVIKQRDMGALSSPIRASQERLYWSEYVVSDRWELESYSDLFSYDPILKKSKRLTKGERLFNPVPSSCAKRLLAVRYPAEGGSSLVMLSTDSLKVIYEFAAPDGYRIKEGVESDNSVIIAAVGSNGISLFIRPLNKEGVWSEILNSKGKIIHSLTYNSLDKRLYYISDYSGVKELYSLNISDLSINQIVNSQFGIEGYSINNNGKVVVSDYSIDGYTLSLPPAKEIITPKWVETPFRDEIADYISSEAIINIDTLTVKSAEPFISQPYRKGSHLFRVHSWAPIYYNIDKIKSMSYETLYDLASPGFMIMSQNSLSTAYTTMGYSWNNGFSSGHLKFRYQGLFPVFEIESSLNTRNRREFTIEPLPGGRAEQIVKEKVNSPFFNSSVLLYVPLSRGVGGWTTGIIPRLYWRFTNDKFYSYQKREFTNYQYLSSGINLYRVRNMTQTQLFPKWGGGISLNYSTVPFSAENFGSLFYTNIYLYTPGITRGHGLKISAAYQQQYNKNKSYLMANHIQFPDGYENLFSRWALKGGVEYAMPLITKDLSLTPAIYLKRIQLNPFFFYCRNRAQKELQTLWSSGGELIFDINLLRISYPISVGVRGGVNGDNRMFASFIFKTPL